MTITIHLPFALREYNNGSAELSVSASTVREALAEIERQNQSIYRSVCDETGAVRRHIMIFVNSASVNGKDGLDRTLSPGDMITIMPAVSGG